MDGKVIESKAKPLGKYSHFRRAGDFVFVSGISARQPDDSVPGVSMAGARPVGFDIRVQTRACLQNIADILAEAGCSLADVVEVTTFLVDMADFAGYNEVYAEFFGEPAPARTTVAAHQLPNPLLRVEIRVVAYRPR